MISVSILGFSGTPDILVKESTLDIALWVKSKMAVILVKQYLEVIFDIIVANL